ncbi:MAG: DNA translocase FtsK 4TM domain-containing protein [Pseudomonadota bacterium]
MASRAVTTSKPSADWRAGLRRSIRRASQMAGAGLLLLTLFFLALALISYTHTDPSLSTAASGDQIGNWMGLAGAWVADAVLLVFGIPGLLLLPLLYISARKLWRDVEQDADDESAPQTMRAEM